MKAKTEWDLGLLYGGSRDPQIEKDINWFERACLAFEKKYNKTVAKAVLVGGGAALKGLADLAKNNFKTEVETGQPFNKVSAPAFLENILREAGPEFAVAIGLALRRLSEEE